MNENDTGLYLLLGIFVAFILILLIVWLAMFINNFSRELRYIKNEIRRNDGEEKKHWLRRKRRLWLSLIPFVKY